MTNATRLHEVPRALPLLLPSPRPLRLRHHRLILLLLLRDRSRARCTRARAISLSRVQAKRNCLNASARDSPLITYPALSEIKKEKNKRTLSRIVKSPRDRSHGCHPLLSPFLDTLISR